MCVLQNTGRYTTCTHRIVSLFVISPYLSGVWCMHFPGVATNKDYYTMYMYINAMLRRMCRIFLTTCCTLIVTHIQTKKSQIRTRSNVFLLTGYSGKRCHTPAERIYRAMSVCSVRLWRTVSVFSGYMYNVCYWHGVYTRNITVGDNGLHVVLVATARCITHEYQHDFNINTR